MRFQDAMRETIQLSQMMLTVYLSDLDEADLLRTPGPGCNPLAFQLGHLISSSETLLNEIRPGSAPALPAGFREQHAEASLPHGVTTKAEYLRLCAEMHAATLTLCEQLTGEELAMPSPERCRSYAPTMASMFILLGTHPIMHMGQIVPIRRAAGKPVVI
jgi:uncharacterized damage-inducible protein DinB